MAMVDLGYVGLYAGCWVGKVEERVADVGIFLVGKLSALKNCKTTKL